MYPNPATNYLYVTSKNVEIQNVSIYNTSGVLVKENCTTTLNITDISKGIYLVHIKTNYGVKVFMRANQHFQLGMVLQKTKRRDIFYSNLILQ